MLAFEYSINPWLAAVFGGVIVAVGKSLLSGASFWSKRTVTRAHVNEGLDRSIKFLDVLNRLSAADVSPELLKQLGIDLTFPVKSKSDGVGVAQEPQPDIVPHMTLNPKLYASSRAMRMRASARYGILIAEMESLLVDLELLVPNDHWEGFRKRQESWEAYRQGLIEIAMHEHEGGTIAPLIGLAEAMSETKRRIAFLTDQVAHYDDHSEVEL